MIAQWTSHLGDKEDKLSFERDIKGAKPVLDRVIAIINDLEKEIDFGELSLDSFDNPNWEYKQAFRLGQRQSLRKIKTLIDLDKQSLLVTEL